MTQIKKAIIDFGTVDVWGRGKRHRAVVEMELRTKDDGRIEFSVCGDIMLANKRGYSCCGQCLDEINKVSNQFTLDHKKLWDKVYYLWKSYHLNTMHAGTPQQEREIHQWLKETGKRYDYTEVCNHLKDVGLYEVEIDGEPYLYGHKWLYEAIPDEDLQTINVLLDIYGREY